MSRRLSKLGKAAIAYIKLGWAVLPLYEPVEVDRCSCGRPECENVGKHPRTAHGVKDATKDEKQIREWWTDWPNANIGIATGPVSGIVVVDIDGEEGEQSWGDLNITEEPTPTQQTGKGRHLGYACPDPAPRSPVGLLPGIDIRCAGTYIVGGPSLHQNGTRYRWEDGLTPDVPLAKLPDVILSLLVAQQYGPQGGDPTSEHKMVGLARNNSLTSHAGSMRRRNMAEATIYTALQMENSRLFDPPLPDREVRDIARGMNRYEPAAEDERSRFTDLGNARQLVHDHQDDLLWVPGVDWLVWDGRRFARDRTGAVDRRAKDTVEGLLLRSTTIEREDERNKAVKHALSSHSASKLRAMISLAATEEAVVATADQLDADPWLLCVENGILDLRTGRLRDHNRADLCSRLASVIYDEGAQAPLWDAFLKRVVPDSEVRAFLQRAVGYFLTGDTSEHCLFLLYGPGANGKSTFLEIIAWLLGEYARAMSFATLTARTRSGQGPSEDLARLHGARYVTAVETGEGVPFNEEMVKQLTGGDRINARNLYQGSFDFLPQFKIILAANHKPTIRGTDDGIWRRIRLVPFTTRIPDAQQDKQLKMRLRSELPGILVWALKGLEAWRETELGQAEVVKTATQEYRNDQDTVRAFIAARCDVLPPDVPLEEATAIGFEVEGDDLYDAYEDWCIGNDRTADTKSSFGRRLYTLDYPKRRMGGGRRSYMRRRIKLKMEEM